jgi:putative membrane protein
MKSVLVCAAIAGLCTGDAAFAQSFGNPGGMSADTPGIEGAKPAGNHFNPQDKLFVRQATLGGRAEVELGKLANSRGSAPAIRDFAQRMVADHGKANDRLAGLDRSANQQLPKSLDPEHLTVRDELQKKQGADFDAAYLTSQVQDHQRTANLLAWEIGMGQNDDLKKYAAEQLPVVLNHLDMAKQQLADLTAAPPPK